MVDLGTYELQDLNTGEVIPEAYFMNAYVEKVFELEHAQNFH